MSNKEQSEGIKKLQSFVILTGVLSVLIVLIYLAAGGYLYNKTHEFMVRNVGGKHKAPHEDVVLLLIDQTSILWGEDIGLGRWPWQRSIYGDILTYLNEGDPPKAVFMDIFFSGRDLSDNESDSVFAAAVRAGGNVFHNIAFEANEERTDIMPLPSDIAESHSFSVKGPGLSRLKLRSSYNQAELPLPCLRADVDCSKSQVQVEGAKTTVKGISVPLVNPDRDGVYRRAFMLHKYGDKYYPSMALAAVNAYQGLANEIEVTDDLKIRSGKYLIPVDKRGNYLVNYHVKQRVVAHSMSKFLESAANFYQGNAEGVTILPGEFKDKIVIIGVSAPGAQDLKNTPIHEKTPGPEIYANVISNILQDNHIITTGRLQAIIISILLMLLTVFIVVYAQNPFVKIGSNIAIYSIFAIVSALLFSYTNLLLHSLFALTTGIIATTGSYMFLSITEGAERRKYSKILGNMIDPTIVKEALSDLETLRKGSEKKITAFFSDVASFSTISEKLSSSELAALLNEYLSAMTVVLKNRKGTLDKYIGDAIVGIFGAPVEVENASLQACMAALEMQAKLRELRDKWVAENAYCPEAQSMSFRIGLNTGLAKVGFMGTADLASYTMMGDTVNLAARLEAAGKDYGVWTLVSQYIRAEIADELLFRKLDAVRVKGKSEPVLIYELVGVRSALAPEVIEAVELYEKGFDLYQSRNWSSAIKHFKLSIRAKGNTSDKAAKLLIARCNEYKISSPPASWDGVFTRTHK